MDEYQALSHTTWDCKYHVVFIPKCRRKTLYAELRRHLGEVFHRLATQKESKILEGHLMPDHVHMLILIPPKYAVSQVVGFGRSGRGGNPRLYSQSGEGGPEIGATQPVALTPPSGGTNFWGRVSDPIYRPGRFQS